MISNDKSALAQAFSRAAANYDHFAAFQRRVGDQLFAASGWQIAGTLLDAGAGSGWYSRLFRQAGHRVIALDLAAGMLQQARQQQAADVYLQGDIEQLPPQADRLDYIWSNLAIQWCQDFPATLSHLQQRLAPGGKIAVSTLAAGSLPEISQVWQQQGLAVPINCWPAAEWLIHQVEGLGLRAWQQAVTCHFPTVMDALWSLKGVGASHLHAGRASGLAGRKHFAQLQALWPRDEQGFRLTYCIVYGVSP